MKTTSRSIARCLLLGAVAFSAVSCVEVGPPYGAVVVPATTTTRVYAAPAPVVVAPAPVVVAPRRAVRRYWW